jgi:hypothetical protein
MIIQIIIGNKFDLNWSTLFSYTGAQQFFQNPTPCTKFLRNGGINDNAQLPYQIDDDAQLPLKNYTESEEKKGTDTQGGIRSKSPEAATHSQGRKLNQLFYKEIH